MCFEDLRGRPINELCNGHGAFPAQYSRWRDQFLDNAHRVFEAATADKRIQPLEAENTGFKNMVAEMALTLKKGRKAGQIPSLAPEFAPETPSARNGRARRLLKTAGKQTSLCRGTRRAARARRLVWSMKTQLASQRLTPHPEAYARCPAGRLGQTGGGALAGTRPCEIAAGHRRQQCRARAQKTASPGLTAAVHLATGREPPEEHAHKMPFQAAQIRQGLPLPSGSFRQA